MTKTKKIVYYVLLVITSLLFAYSGYDKVSGDPMAVAGFMQAHLAIWFMYFIGTAEILGAIGLWIPKLQKWAAYGLFIVLFGAVVTTAMYISAVMAIFPLVVGIALYFVLKLGKQKMAVPVMTTPQM